MKTKIRAVLSASPAELKAKRTKEKKEKQKQMQESGIVRDGLGRWIKGTSGNDLGRPRTALAALCREQLTKHRLVECLGSIASRSGDYAKKSKIPVTVSDQVGAIKLLLLYGYGMPKQEMDANGDVKIEVTYADNRQVTVTNAPRSAGADHSRSEEIQRSLMRPEIREDDAWDGQADSSGAAR